MQNMSLTLVNYVHIQFKVDRPQTTVVAKNLSVLQLFISRMPKICAILQLVSAPSSTTIDVRLKGGLFALTSASSNIRDFQYGGDKPSNEKQLCLFTVPQSGEVKFS